MYQASKSTSHPRTMTYDPPRPSYSAPCFNHVSCIACGTPQDCARELAWQCDYVSPALHLTVRFAQAQQHERQLRAEFSQVSMQTNPIEHTLLSVTCAENQAEIPITRRTNPIEKDVLSETFAEKPLEVCTQSQIAPDSPVVSPPVLNELGVVPVASAGWETPQSPKLQARTGWRNRVATQHRLVAPQPCS